MQGTSPFTSQRPGEARNRIIVATMSDISYMRFESDMGHSLHTVVELAASIITKVR
jgi:hypothetical protein